MKKGEAGREELVSLCQLPLVLDPEAKARIMQGEALLQKQHEVQASAINVGTLCCFWLLQKSHEAEASTSPEGNPCCVLSR